MSDSSSPKKTEFWWQKPGVEFAKVTYLTKEGTKTQAYIDANTGYGENRHTDIPVQVKWSDELDIWVQVDDWEWVWDEFNGIWLPKPPPGWTPPEKEPFVRTQPKRLTRRQRRNHAKQRTGNDVRRGGDS